MCCCQEQAVASLELWVSGCLFAELASQQPGAAGCNYALQLQRKFLAAGPCAGPGCTLTAGLKGTMEIETSGSRGRGGAGRGRRQAERKGASCSQRCARRNPRLHSEDPCSCSQTEKQSLRPPVNSPPPPPRLCFKSSTCRTLCLEVCLADILNSTSQPV